MPITGRFLADFASFYDAVQKAEVSLRSFETGASKVEKQLNKTSDAFSGRKILADAELAVRAVNDIGGATKLTESEQRKLNATLTEAIAKTKALGYEASKDMQAMADATKHANSEVNRMPSALSGIKSTLTGIAGAFGVAFSIGAVVNFGKSVFNSASQIHDLSEQLGISAEAVQGFKFAAEQSGSSLDTVGTAITKMNRNLAEGDKSTIASLRTAGLSFSQIRNLKPEDAFLAIADAIQKIPDPMVQSQVAMQLFGRSAGELLPGIKEGFRGVAEGADKMSDDTIDSLEAAQDAWEKLGNRVTIITGNLIANTANAAKGMTGSLTKFATFVENAFKFGIGNAANIAGTIQAVEDKTGAGPKAGPTEEDKRRFNDAAKSAEALADAQKKAEEAAKRHSEAIRDLAAVYSGAKSIQEAKDALAAVNINLRKGVDIAEMSEEQQIALNRAVTAGIDVYTRQGREAPAALIKIQTETQKIIDIQADAKASLDEWSEAVRRHQDEYKQGEAETLAFLEQQEQERTDVAKAALDDYAEVVRRHQQEQKQGEDDTLRFLDDQRKRYEESKKAVHELASALAQLAQVSGGAFGDIVRDLSTMVESLNVARKSIDAITGSLKGGFSLSGLADMTSGILGMASAAIAAGKAIANMLDRNKGRDLVTAFAGEHGGFDNIHKELLALGQEGEQLWINLTQGVGRNNPEQARQAIEAINEALSQTPATLGDQAASAGFHTTAELKKIANEAERLFEFMRDSGEYSAEAVQEAWERANAALIASGDQTAIAAKKAGDEVRKLDDQIKSLTDSIANEAPEEVMGVIEAQTRAQIDALQQQRDAAQQAIEDTAGQAADSAEQAAKEIDAVLRAHDFVAKLRFEYELPEHNLPGFASGTHGQYLNFGSGTPVMLHGRERVMTEGEGSGAVTITVPLYLEGQKIAEATVPYIPDAMKRYVG